MQSVGKKSSDGNRGFSITAYALSLIFIILVALSPLISVMLADFIATSAGCVLNEATSHPCVIAGIDVGNSLYTLGFLGWFMIATIPIGAILLICWVIALVVHFSKKTKIGSNQNRP